MSKELEALKEARNHRHEKDENLVVIDIDYFNQCLDGIETELKEKEKQDSVLKTLREVIEFGQMLPHIEPNKDNGFDIMSAVRINIQRDIENKERELLRKWVLETCFPKELKALNVIKEKNVDIDFLKYCWQEFNDEVGIEQYNIRHVECSNNGKPLTKEEYNFLKEVLL